MTMKKLLITLTMLALTAPVQASTEGCQLIALGAGTLLEKSQALSDEGDWAKYLAGRIIDTELWESPDVLDWYLTAAFLIRTDPSMATADRGRLEDEVYKACMEGSKQI